MSWELGGERREVKPTKGKGIYNSQLPTLNSLISALPQTKFLLFTIPPLIFL
jgi:hypothetical protein